MSFLPFDSCTPTRRLMGAGVVAVDHEAPPSGRIENLTLAVFEVEAQREAAAWDFKLPWMMLRGVLLPFCRHYFTISTRVHAPMHEHARAKEVPAQSASVQITPPRADDGITMPNPNAASGALCALPVRTIPTFARLPRPACAWSTAFNTSTRFANRGLLTVASENICFELLTTDVRGTPVQLSPRRRTLASLPLNSAPYTRAPAEKLVFSSSTSIRRAGPCDRRSVREHPLIKTAELPLCYTLHPRAMRQSVARKRGRVKSCVYYLCTNILLFLLLGKPGR